MRDVLVRSWWMLALRGIAAILFGVLALIWPGLTLLWLVALFAVFAIVAGAAAIMAALRVRGQGGWVLELALGIVSVLAGALAIAYPGLTAITLIVFIGANAFVTGVIDILMAVRLRRQMRNEWLLVAAGVVSIAFGAIVLVFPAAGALALVWFVSFYAMVSGVLLLILAFRARHWRIGDAVAGARPAALHR